MTFNESNKQGRKEMSEGLMKFLADSYAVYLKTQNAHWNVVGREFFGLHLMLEKQYEELSEALDEIAERIRALGHTVHATFSTFKALTSISEEKQIVDAKTMIEHLLSAHDLVICLARELTEKAEKQKDPATIDLLARRLGAHEKTAWMLRSHLEYTETT